MSNSKLPGHEPEIEQNIIGCMQVERKFAEEVLRDVKENDFTNDCARRVFLVLRDQVMSGGNADYGCYTGVESPELAGYSNDAVAYCTPTNLAWLISELKRATQTRSELVQAQRRIWEIEQGYYRPQIQERTQSCQENEVSEQIELEISGKRQAVPFPSFNSLCRTQALLPGTLTVLCGSPGASKSFLLVQWLMGFPCLSTVLMLEDTTGFHLRRAMALERGVAGLTSDRWCRENTQNARALVAACGPRMTHFKEVKLIQTPAPNQAPTIDFVVNWAEDEARRGVRVIGIDPVSMVEMRGAVWEGNKRLVMGLKRVAEQYGVSIITVNHPVGGKAGIKIMPSLENIAGGQSWQRFTHTVLWLEACHMAETEIETPPLPMKSNKAQYNRVLHILKSRMGMGAGQRIACLFDSKTLRHSELGVMV